MLAKNATFPMFGWRRTLTMLAVPSTNRRSARPGRAFAAALCPPPPTSTMQVRKAVITAAAPQQNRLPLQQLVDRRGRERTAISLIVEEATSAGVEDVAIVIRPGDQPAYESATEDAAGNLQFITQDQPRGYADALAHARDFVDRETFLHLVGDHLYVENGDRPCATQLIAMADAHQCSVSAVQDTRETNLPHFGVVSGPRVPREERLFEVEKVIEKPTPTQAEQELITPGLRSGRYLAFFGMHVLTSEVMNLLCDVVDDPKLDRPTLSDALARLPGRGRYLAHQIQGSRYNLAATYGLLRAQLAIGLAGRDRDLILTELIDVLATRAEGAAHA